MKRILSFSLMLVLLLLCGCGPKDPAADWTSPSTTAAPTETTTVPTEETTVPTEPPVLYRHPLTGEPLDEPFSGHVVAITNGNTKAALPQHGISQADILYELEAEGGATRLLPLYTDLTNVAQLGSVRSTRTQLNSVAVSYNAVLFHCGGSKRGVKGYHDADGSKISDWQHVNQFYNGKYFYRDDQRKAEGYAYEHRLFSTGELLMQALSAKGFEPQVEPDFGLQFTDELVLEGEVAEKIVFTFPGGKKTGFTYDEATGVYTATQHGTTLIDGTTGEPVTFNNLIFLSAKWSYSSYTLMGEGEGYLASGGKIVKIKWFRGDLKGPFTYTYEDGTPVSLAVGHSYIGITSRNAKAIQYEPLVPPVETPAEPTPDATTEATTPSTAAPQA